MLPGCPCHGLEVGCAVPGAAGATVGDAGVAPIGAAGVAPVGTAGAAGLDDELLLNQFLTVLTELETEDEKADVNVLKERWPDGVLR